MDGMRCVDEELAQHVRCNTVSNMHSVHAILQDPWVVVTEKGNESSGTYVWNGACWCRVWSRKLQESTNIFKIA